METGAALRALKPTSLRTGGLSHTPLREGCFFRGEAPEKKRGILPNSARLQFDAICFAAEAAKFCEAVLVAHRATLDVGELASPAEPALAVGRRFLRHIL